MDMNQNHLVASSAVMKFFGYTNRAAFWHFVKTKGVPCITLNARRIMFDPVALNQWLARRNSSGEPRQFAFSDADETR